MKTSISKMFGLTGNDETDGQVQEINISRIKPNPFQPRRHFDPIQLEELANSIKEYGVIQPIIVRKSGPHYELVAGERRLRASQLLGMKTIPALVKRINDSRIAEIALIENLQREDLNYFEEAEGYSKLIQEFSLTQEEVAKRVGKSQSTIANKMRLLKLPEIVKKNITCDVITERHARALLKLPDVETQIEALKEIYENELNVRETDMLVEKILTAKGQGTHKTEQSKKIVRIFKDLRIYLNAIRQAVHTIEAAGLDVNMKESNHDEYIEVVIQIPKSPRR